MNIDKPRNDLVTINNFSNKQSLQRAVTILSLDTATFGMSEQQSAGNFDRGHRKWKLFLSVTDTCSVLTSRQLWLK